MLGIKPNTAFLSLRYPLVCIAIAVAVACVVAPVKVASTERDVQDQDGSYDLFVTQREPENKGTNLS
jgi:hypothetical protein